MNNIDKSLVDISVKSCASFPIPRFAVEASLMGSCHEFIYESHKIKIYLPNIEQADLNNGQDEVAVARFWPNAQQNVPSEYCVNVINLEIDLDESILVPECVTGRHHNIAMFRGNTANQKNVNKVIDKHSEAQNLAYQYWLEILRWSTNNPFIGIINGDTSRITQIGVCLLSKINDQIVASSAEPLACYYEKVITLEHWESTQKRLSKEFELPIYIRFKFEAQESMRIDRYERAITELAYACETYIRYSYFEYLPEEHPREVHLHNEVIKYLEKASIIRYVEDFFKQIVKDESQYMKLISDLKELFKKRNDYVHRGLMNGANLDTCNKFLRVTEDLFKLEKVENIVKASLSQ